jgi:hypothetical protein
MCLTPSRLLSLAGLVALSLVGGCRFASNEAPKMNLDQTPLIVDEAMQRRDWDRTPAYYANGDTVAGPNLVVVEGTGPDVVQRVTDPTASVTNAIIAPATFILSPPWKDMVYQGMVIPPTYTAQPPPNPIR